MRSPSTHRRICIWYPVLTPGQRTRLSHGSFLGMSLQSTWVRRNLRRMYTFRLTPEGIVRVRCNSESPPPYPPRRGTRAAHNQPRTTLARRGTHHRCTLRGCCKHDLICLPGKPYARRKGRRSPRRTCIGGHPYRPHGYCSSNDTWG